MIEETYIGLSFMRAATDISRIKANGFVNIDLDIVQHASRGRIALEWGFGEQAEVWQGWVAKALERTRVRA